MLTICGLITAEPAFATGVGLPPERYGFAMCLNDAGERVTLAARDPDVIEEVMEALDSGAVTPGGAPVRFEPATFPLRRPGWPEDWLERPLKDTSAWSGAWRLARMTRRVLAR